MGGELTEEQEAYRDYLHRDGGVYVAARSTDDLEDYIRPLL